MVANYAGRAPGQPLRPTARIVVRVLRHNQRSDRHTADPCECIIAIVSEIVRRCEQARFVATMIPQAVVFKMPKPDDVAKMLRADLDAAGICERDDAARVVDIHALRHTFITSLASGGVHPKTAQTMDRHSTISLTMDRYTHTMRGEEAAALPTLPDLSPASREVAKATGTHDACADEKCCTSVALTTPGGTRRSLSAKGGTTPVAGETGRSRQCTQVPNRTVVSDGSCHSVSPTGREKRRGGDSNPRYRCDPVRRFSKPLLSAAQPPLQTLYP